jgi:5-methylcytosine-specific restriction protein A
MCAWRGCPKLTYDRFCDEHKAVAEEYNKKRYAKHYERYKRDPITWDKYNGEWRRISKQFLQRNPLCEHCKEYGRLTPAELVHHKKPLSEGGTNDYDNLQALCRSCHTKHHNAKKIN